MKRLIVLFPVTLLILATAGWADPPKTVDLSYDKATKQLTVSGQHGVGDPTKHYIKTVQISVNGQQVAEQKMDQQKDAAGYSVTVPLEIKDTDKVEAKVTCSKFGSKTGTLASEAEKKTIRP